MVSIGIDPSINSTGVCVLTYINSKISVQYYIITGKASKSTLAFAKDNNVNVLIYDKKTNDHADTYTDKEIKKYHNFNSICSHVMDILVRHAPDYVTMEGISYGSVGSSALADLAGLNFMIRDVIFKYTNANMMILSPTENKRFAVGCGQINKTAIIDTWCLCEDIKTVGNAKVDDIADAYFMALYQAMTCDEFKNQYTLPKVTMRDEYRHKVHKDAHVEDDANIVFYDIGHV